MIIYDTVTMHL